MKLNKFNGALGYKKLSHLPFNRNFTLRSSLVQSIKKYGFIVPAVVCYSSAIDGIRRLYILDGQNRCLAAQYLDISFYAVIIPDIETKEELVQTISKLNNSSLAWKNKVYVEAYSSLGFIDYTTLLKLSNEYGYSVALLGGMLMGHYKSSGGSSTKTIKEGTFKINCLDVTLKSLTLAKGLPKLNARMFQAFHAVRLCNDNFDFAIFKKKLNDSYLEIKSSKLNQYKDLFNSWF